MSLKILIGIIACNQKSKTLACLESLEKSQFQDFEVFLVDNGSGEGIGEAAKQFSFVTVHLESQNVGAAAGRNIIIRHFLQGEWPYLLFLDNDVILLPDTLGNAVRRAEEWRARAVPWGGLGAHIVYRNEPEKYWSAGGALIDWENAWFRDTGQGERNGVDFQESRRVESIPTAFLLVTREAVEKVGDFAEDYFFYFEDADWCWRLIKAGFQLWSVPEALVLHDVSSALGICSPEFHYLRTRNRMWFFQAFSPKNCRQTRWRIFKSVMRGSVYPEFLSGNFQAAAAVILGFLAGLRVPSNIQKVAQNGA